jgi:hypothetical protein
LRLGAPSHGFPLERCVAVIGSRDFGNPGLVRLYVQMLAPGTILVSGRGRGPDTWAEETADWLGMQKVIHPAEWGKHARPGRGNPAGMLRNPDIVRDSGFMAAFWDSRSRGTRNSLELMLAAGRPHIIFDEYGYQIQL